MLSLEETHCRNPKSDFDKVGICILSLSGHWSFPTQSKVPRPAVHIAWTSRVKRTAAVFQTYGSERAFSQSPQMPGDHVKGREARDGETPEGAGPWRCCAHSKCCSPMPSLSSLAFRSLEKYSSLQSPHFMEESKLRLRNEMTWSGSEAAAVSG